MLWTRSRFCKLVGVKDLFSLAGIVESQHNRLHIQHVRTAGVQGRTGIFITSAMQIACTPADVCLHSCIVTWILILHYHELRGKRGVQEETIYLREQSFFFLHFFFSAVGILSLRWRGGQRVPAEYRCNGHSSFCAAAVCSDLCDEQMPSLRPGTRGIRARTSYSVSCNPGSWGEQKTAVGRKLCRGAIGALVVVSALQHYSNAHTSRCRPQNCAKCTSSCGLCFQDHQRVTEFLFLSPTIVSPLTLLHNPPSALVCERGWE